MVKTNLWYKLKRADFNDFIEALKLSYKYVYRIWECETAFEAYDWLYLRATPIDAEKVCLHYRTEYNDKYMRTFELYSPIKYEIPTIKEMNVKPMNNINEAMRELWGWPNKVKNLEETNMKSMEKEEAIIKLVNEYYNNEREALIRIRDTSINDVKLNSKAYKICDSLYNIARAKGAIISNIMDCIPASCYTAEEEAEIAKIKDDFIKYEKELQQKCDECQNLLILCDTFEERMKILKKYKIVK